MATPIHYDYMRDRCLPNQRPKVIASILKMAQQLGRPITKDRILTRALVIARNTAQWEKASQYRRARLLTWACKEIFWGYYKVLHWPQRRTG